jgi:replicative DNA helicase
MTSASDLHHMIDSETEAMVIGTILRAGEPALGEVDFLTPEDFSIETHRIIFHVILDLAPEVRPTIDAVAHRLAEKGKITAVGGFSGLVDIDAKGIEGIRLHGFGRTLRRLATDRRAYRLHEKLAKAMELGFSANSSEVRSITDEIRGLDDDLTGDAPARTFGQCLDEAGGIDALCAPPRNTIPLAWENRFLQGLAPGQLIVAAGAPVPARPSSARSKRRMRRRLGHRTLFVSLEMSVPEMLKRFLAMIARVRHADLQQGDLTIQQRLMVQDAATRLSAWPLEITTDCRTLDSIGAKLQEERKRGNPYRLVVVDYLQLIGVGSKFENRTQEVSHVSRGLKLCAAENECSVLALSQLSRASESRPGDHEPRLSDLRDSGSIEQDADVVLFIHRPELYKPNEPALKNAAKMIVGKQRNGALGSFGLVWVPQHVTFTESGVPEQAA